MTTNHKLMGAAAGIVIIAIVVFFVMRGGDVPPTPVTNPTPVVADLPAPNPTPTLREQLSARLREVTLATSDAAVRELVGEISAHPGVLSWLVNDDLIRRFTAAVDNVANGRSPRTHLDFLRPDKPFKVVEGADGWTVDPAGYERYNTVTEAVVALDNNGVATLFSELHPLINEAYREIAPPQSDFEQRLDAAFDHLLACPVVEGPVEVTPKVVTYTFVDPQLEGLSAAQRQLLRFGPDNVRAIQAKLRDLRTAMLGE